MPLASLDSGQIFLALQPLSCGHLWYQSDLRKIVSYEIDLMSA